VFPGQNTAATLTLSGVSAGSVFALSSSHPDIAPVPATVSVGSNGTTASLQVFTGQTSVDTNVTITASIRGETRTATLLVGSGPFFSFVSPSDDFIGQGRARRAAHPDFGFNAAANATLSGIDATITARGSGSSWTLRLASPTGLEIRSGLLYDGAVRSATATSAGLQFTGFGRGCSQIDGAFLVRELQYGSILPSGGRTIERLHVQFIQSCDGRGPLQGELYLIP
jgi:hypothetical protein